MPHEPGHIEEVQVPKEPFPGFGKELERLGAQATTSAGLARTLTEFAPEVIGKGEQEKATKAFAERATTLPGTKPIELVQTIVGKIVPALAVDQKLIAEGEQVRKTLINVTDIAKRDWWRFRAFGFVQVLQQMDEFPDYNTLLSEMSNMVHSQTGDLMDYTPDDEDKRWWNSTVVPRLEAAEDKKADMAQVHATMTEALTAKMVNVDDLTTSEILKALGTRTMPDLPPDLTTAEPRCPILQISRLTLHRMHRTPYRVPLLQQQ